MALLTVPQLRLLKMQWTREVRYERTPRRWFGLRGGKLIEVVEPAAWYSPEGDSKHFNTFHDGVLFVEQHNRFCACLTFHKDGGKRLIFRSMEGRTEGGTTSHLDVSAWHAVLNPPALRRPLVPGNYCNILYCLALRLSCRDGYSLLSLGHSFQACIVVQCSGQHV